MNRHTFVVPRASAIALCVFLLALGGCGKRPPPTPVDQLAAIAEAAAKDVAEQTTDPHEIKMIEYKRNLMGKPGLQMYVVFLNDMGQPIDYFIVKGKCSSSNKRLTDPTQIVEGDRGSYTGYFDVPGPGVDGTYGESDEYIFCKTVDGKYKQWNGEYLQSDYPFELTIKPLIVKLGATTQQQQ
jgi:hypothetical protein